MLRVTTIMMGIIILFSSCSTEQQEVADFVFTNGNVYTVNTDQPTAEAVAIKGNKIVFVGQTDDMLVKIPKQQTSKARL